ncbi:MAG: hypothetical protein N2316_07610 [Spirochaetes bacterium]|nr:hypothetical protein [Spirochaetota bacterium]
MGKESQLTFSDDSFVINCNMAYQLIEEGKFVDALEKISQLMDKNPDFPGVSEAYRTIRFWLNRLDSLEKLKEGKETADFLMKEWAEFHRYSAEKNMLNSGAYASAMKYIFFRASEHYTRAFVNEESTVDNFDLLLNLGICFITLGDYQRAIDTLEYAKSSLRSSAKLLSLLGEAYYHIDEIPKSLLCFKEAFFLNPTEIDLQYISAKPVIDLIQMARNLKPNDDPREWVPVLGFVQDIFYVRKRLNSQQVEAIKRDIFTLERAYQKSSREKIEETKVIPRLINRYLWMLEYFEYQHYDLESINEIRGRLLKLDRDLFKEYFDRKKGFV